MNLDLFVVMGQHQGNMRSNMTHENFTLNNETEVDDLLVSLIEPQKDNK